MSVMKSWFSVIGFATILMTVGCGKQAPNAPSEMAVEVSSPEATMATTYATPLVTLGADLTASPAFLTVPVGGKVRMVNNTGRALRIFSYTCTEFSTIALSPGYSANTLPFRSTGKTCDYFAWDYNWSRKILVGQVVVQ
jgi:hypothetical protein